VRSQKLYYNMRESVIKLVSWCCYSEFLQAISSICYCIIEIIQVVCACSESIAYNKLILFRKKNHMTDFSRYLRLASATHATTVILAMATAYSNWWDWARSKYEVRSMFRLLFRKLGCGPAIYILSSYSGMLYLLFLDTQIYLLNWC